MGRFEPIPDPSRVATGVTGVKDAGGAARRPSRVEKCPVFSTRAAALSTKAGVFSTRAGAYVEEWGGFSTWGAVCVEKTPRSSTKTLVRVEKSSVFVEEWTGYVKKCLAFSTWAGVFSTYPVDFSTRAGGFSTYRAACVERAAHSSTYPVCFSTYRPARSTRDPWRTASSGDIQIPSRDLLAALNEFPDVLFESICDVTTMMFLIAVRREVGRSAAEATRKTGRGR